MRTLDAVIQQGGQVVVTASSAPREIAGFPPALQSRLSAGLCVPLALPGPDTRLAILQRWSNLREVEMAESILKLLAKGLAGTVPELLGAMLQLEVPAREEGRPIRCPPDPRILCRGATRPCGPNCVTSPALTARHFALRLSDFRGTSRRRPVVAARDVAIYLCRQLTRESLTRIGEYFGGRDHTTVLHACRKTEELFGRTLPSGRRSISCSGSSPGRESDAPAKCMHNLWQKRLYADVLVTNGRKLRTMTKLTYEKFKERDRSMKITMRA